MKKHIAILALASAMGLSANAENRYGVNEVLGDVKVSSTVAFESEYVFRGGVQYSGPAIQPGIDFSLPFFEGDLYLGYWGSYQVSNGASTTAGQNFQETDIYLGYSTEITDHVGIDFGFTYYMFPDTAGVDSWEELYIGLNFSDTLPEDWPELNPAIYAYYNFTGNALTLEGSIGHSVSLGKLLGSSAWSLDLGAHIGTVTFDDANGDKVGGSPEDSYSYMGGSVDLVYTFNNVASLSLGVRYARNSNKSGVNLYEFAPNEDSFWWGTSVSFGF